MLHLPRKRPFLNWIRLKRSSPNTQRLRFQGDWPTLSTYFKYPQEVRTLIYTTNMIENFNRQLRKVTKSKTIFPTDDSLMKILYLAMTDVTKKWTQSRRDWGKIHSQLEIYFADRLDG